MKKIIYIVAVIVLFCSCKKDEEENALFDTSILYGEWYSNVNGVVTDLNLNSLTLFGSIFNTVESELKLYEKWSGSWLYYSENKILCLSIVHSSTSNETTHYYQIVNVDDYSLILKDQEFGNIEKYEKVVESQNLKVGEIGKISYISEQSLTSESYNSSNSLIASCDSSGKIEAKKKGIAFISIITNKGTLIVKVEVN